ncbi:MAG: hypothetical protein INR64_11780, partial [Caulobacteraceae bacterium]|nr:hypothetical protein [Caulobacter sp.]
AAKAEPRKRRRGCATPLSIVLVAVLVGVSWCVLHRLPTAGAPAVAGASAARPLHVSRRWRTVRLPGDASATAHFAVSSDTALRVRAGEQLYVVRPRHPLRLPDDVGDSFDVRVADYVSNADAARAKAALITLGG